MTYAEYMKAYDEGFRLSSYNDMLLQEEKDQEVNDDTK